MRKVLVLAGILGFAQGAAAFQIPSLQQSSSTELTVNPTTVAAGAPVTISGSVGPSKQPLSVKIDITPPTGTQVSLAAHPDAQGQYSISFTQTSTPGRFHVNAVPGDGRPGGTADFTVIAVDSVLDGYIKEGQDMLASVKQLADTAGQELNKAPGSPSQKQAVAAKLADFNQQLAALDGFFGSHGSVTQSLNDLKKELHANPAAIPATAPLLDAMLAGTGEVHAQRLRLMAQAKQKRAGAAKTPRTSLAPMSPLETMPWLEPVSFSSAIAEASGGQNQSPLTKPDCGSLHPEACHDYPTDSSACEGLNTFAQVLDLSSMLLSWFSSFTDYLWKIGISAVTPSASSNSPWFNSAAALGWKVTVKEEVRNFQSGKLGAKKIAGYAIDLVKFADESLYKGICDRFVGPMSAEMEAHAYVQNYGVEWWAFDVMLKGTLELRFKKPFSAYEEVQVSGEFQGEGSRFHVWEQAIDVLFPKFHNGRLSTHKLRALYLPFTELECVAGPGCKHTPFGTQMAQEEEINPYVIGDFAGSDVPRGGAGSSTSSTPFDSKLKELGNVLGGAAWLTQYLPFTYASFNVPVEGTLRGSKLQLHLDPAILDFDPDFVKAHARYLILDMLMPATYSTVVEFSLPYKNAEFILGRAMENKPIELSMQQQEHGEMVTFKHEYEHRGQAAETFEDGQTLQTQTMAIYRLTFKACSSPCH